MKTGRSRIELNWTVGFAPTADADPDRRVPAKVPGAVQLDWATAEGWGPHTYADNYRQYDWMEDVYWSYVARVERPKLEPGQRLVFASRGIDYQFAVSFNGKTLHQQEGMFTPVEIDLTDAARDGGTLEVRVAPAPKSVPDEKERSRTQANRSCKPAVSYGWDFHPRLIPLGIWDETCLEVRPERRLTDAELRYTLSADLATANLSVIATASGGAPVRWRLRDPDGAVVVERTEKSAGAPITATLQRPRLWWPNGQGGQPLYTFEAEALDAAGNVSDVRTSRVGFRRARLVMHPGAWREPSQFPKSRSTPPITLEINGRAIFCKGANWVSPDVFPGTLSEEVYRRQLALVRESNMNILRLWGGAPVQKEAFYDLCDELGILVWQEFPLACNAYPDDAKYLGVLGAESVSIIRRLRQHACLAIWCGGNELFNAWSGMTDQAHALRLLNRNCFDLDPATPFLPTSPVMGMGHGHYTFRDARTGLECWQMFQQSACTAYTEFGNPGPAPLHVLKSIMPQKELFPPAAGSTWEHHFAFKAWEPNSWLDLHNIEQYFGPCESVEQVVERGQWLQAEGYKGLFEEARRQKPTCAMALNWCLNEPYPCAANNSLISWPCEPKPALKAVADACRPALASARVRKFSWHEGEWFDPELWVLSDSPEPLPGGRLTASLVAAGHEIKLLDWEFPTLPANANQRGPRVQFQLPRLNADEVELRLTIGGRPELGSAYRLVYRSKESTRRARTRTMNL